MRIASHKSRDFASFEEELVDILLTQTALRQKRTRERGHTGWTQGAIGADYRAAFNLGTATAGVVSEEGTRIQLLLLEASHKYSHTCEKRRVNTVTLARSVA